MNHLPLNQWIDITATSNMPLYAVLNNTGDSQAMKEYYVHDGSETPYGLYSGTPYESWFSVMPRIVPLSNNSPFLTWIASTQHKDWGWLARSPFPLDVIAGHLRSLTQVIMPTGETVFFRYWDGEYMVEHLRFLGDKWGQILPAFPFYWINGEYFTLQIPLKADVQTSPWWTVEQALMDKLIKSDPRNVAEQLVSQLKQYDPELYQHYPEKNLLIKAQRFIEDDAFSMDTAYNDFRKMMSGVA